MKKALIFVCFITTTFSMHAKLEKIHMTQDFLGSLSKLAESEMVLEDKQMILNRYPSFPIKLNKGYKYYAEINAATNRGSGMERATFHYSFECEKDYDTLLNLIFSRYFGQIIININWYCPNYY